MNSIWERVTNLATCLCATCEENATPLCFCGVVPGLEVALDYHGNCANVCGMAWVRVSAMYPASSVGAVNTQPGNCGSLVGVDVELGIMRCMPVGEADGSPPTPDQLRAAAELQISDALALWSAVRCCDPDSDWLIGQYQPFGPSGGIVGGTVEVNFLEV